MKWTRALTLPAAALAGLAAYDLRQRKHALLRNFPVIGHGRYLLESIGPELRQYIVTSNDEERPFSRDQRRWIYTSSKLENNYFGFGTDNDIEHTQGYPVIKHRTFARVAPPTGPRAGEAMFAVGCIQAQKCHTDRCPTGVATQDRWLTGGLDPALESVRAANDLRTLRRDPLKVAEACGVVHPGLIGGEDVDVLYGDERAVPLYELYGYEPGWGQPSDADRAALHALMDPAEVHEPTS